MRKDEWESMNEFIELYEGVNQHIIKEWIDTQSQLNQIKSNQSKLTKGCMLLLLLLFLLFFLLLFMM